MAAMAARRPWPSWSFPDQNLPIPGAGPGVDHLAVSQSQLRERPPFFFLQCSMARLSMPPPPSPSCSFLLHRPRPPAALGTSPRPREMDLPPSATSPPYRAHASTSGQRKPGQPRKQARPQQPPPPPPSPQPPVPPQQEEQQVHGQDPNLPAEPQMEQYEVLDLNNGPPFAPYQRAIDDIPVIQLDIRKEGLHGRVAEVAKRRIVRARSISPGCYYNVPITPYPNPKNGKSGWGKAPLSNCGHSHHTIELLHTSSGDGVRVQLLMRDFDVYFPAFRVSKDNGITWSPWYTFKEQKLPPFIPEDDIIYLPITGAHSQEYDIGGYTSFYRVFTELANYAENLNQDSLKEPVMIAVFLFSEAIRDRFMHLEILSRIKNDAEPFPLGYNMIDWATKKKIYLSPDIVYERVHSWSMFGETCTDVGMNGGRFDPRSLTEKYNRLYGINHFQEMIGRDCGHLLIIMRNSHKMEVTTQKLMELQKKNRGEDMANPDFDNLFDKDGERIPLPTYDV